MNTKLLLPLFLIFLTTCFVPIRAQVYQVVWSDEFDNTGLPNSSKWSYDVGGDGWGNSELQYYTSNRTENARVENGNLIIEARKETYGSNAYTSARLISKLKGDWLYGRIEVKAKLPSGKGTWPAIWMLPTDWAYGNWPKSGEIDIMEHVGYDPITIFGTVHTEAFNHTLGTQKGANIKINDCETAFHIYAIEWTETKIDFFVDDTKYFTFTKSGDYKSWPFDKRFHLLLNLAVGGSWGGAQGVDDNIFPQKMYVDYVRVYDLKSEITITGSEFALPQNGGNIYSAPLINNATYQWTVPNDATILSGQGTNQIDVKWGDTDGEIAVNIAVDGKQNTVTKNVKYIVVPQTDEYTLYDIVQHSKTGWLPNSNIPSNVFQFDDVKKHLKISFLTGTTTDWAHVIYTFPRPVYMNDLSAIQAFIAQNSASKTVNLRIDLIDVFGVETNGGEIFKQDALYNDGTYHEYGFNFEGNWISNSPNIGQVVDSKRIAGLKMYINYGVFGKQGITDSVLVRNIKITKSNMLSIDNQAKMQFKIYPNPVAEQLHISVTSTIEMIRIADISGKIVWQQRGENKTEVQLSISHLPQGMYFIEIGTAKGRYTEKLVKM